MAYSDLKSSVPRYITKYLKYLFLSIFIYIPQLTMKRLMKYIIKKLHYIITSTIFFTKQQRDYKENTKQRFQPSL